ncbi:hypothetical protein F4556_005081 [Kitasatospora gansuensis]|uniref:4Fe-4S Wbl-type domain-containing protein n=1 Tax=Kitasatospora gansuensis TaxID=258050 RepID=A0A7W7WJQ2_9ACTN|nr:hypothetical protein [Kitasatospora gansuensis]MBB4949546.1 hypothetical protein [Kitasatospora gansuensis]
MFTALPDTDLFMPACFRDPRYSPAEGKWKTKDGLTRICAPVLPNCTPCPHRAQCISQVAPHARKFDGVCGGRIWLDGEVIVTADGVDEEDLPLPGKARDTCGTTAGVDKHHVFGEQKCEGCRAVAEATAEQQPAEAEGQLTLAFAA